MGEYTCPHCHNPIHDDDALLCHFCGESLGRASDGFMSNLKYSPLKFLTVAVIFLIVISFLLLILR